MFLYDEDSKKLFVTIPSKLQYNFNFLNNITELMDKVNRSECDMICFYSKKKSFNFDKLSAAYLWNTILFLGRDKTILISQPLYDIFHNQVSHSDGEKFEKIDITKVSESKIQQCYYIRNDKSVNQTVQILVDFISENNLVLENAKEFLVTTIGEIFTNAFGHSNEKKAFFMYDIEWYNQKFYLVINITDYGKTIVHNVQQYQKSKFGRKMDCIECIRWAVEIGNTTRLGSGGYGLPTLIDYVRNIKGELLIFSGNGIYALKEKKQNMLNSNGNFYGTSISMKIPLFDTSQVIIFDETKNKIGSMDLDKI